jgi:hypothetical protein
MGVALHISQSFHPSILAGSALLRLLCESKSYNKGFRPGVPLDHLEYHRWKQISDQQNTSGGRTGFDCSRQEGSRA